MTKHARLVLADAREAADELPDGTYTLGDESTIRRRTAAVMALLRAVGHVLNEVDGRHGSVHLRQAITGKWREPKPKIRVFIDGQRNALLKRYEHADTDFDFVMGTACRWRPQAATMVS